MVAAGLANKLNTFENRDDCKCLFKRKTVPLKIQVHCKWPLKIWWYLSNVWLQAFLWNKNTPYIEIYVTYVSYIQLMVASSLLRNSVSIEEKLAATTFVK